MQKQTFRKEIVYDRKSRDYVAYLDGELKGFSSTYQIAKTLLDEIVFGLLNDKHLENDTYMRNKNQPFTEQLLIK